MGGFSGYHPNGVNFLFGDGSIRFIRTMVNPKVYQHLANRADGVALGDDQY